MVFQKQLQAVENAYVQVMSEKSEKMVKNILDAFQIRFLNPFYHDIEKSNLYNLVSGGGDFGKTPQFWVMYMIMVDRQQKLHYAINTNNYSLRLLIWKESLPMWFATNKIYYARYGTFYVKFLEYLEDTHPGAKEEIEEKGFSVRCNTLGIGQAVDMAGEQSYMKSAKTAGGICQVSANEATVAKWVMNRPFQARFAETLMEISGL